MKYGASLSYLFFLYIFANPGIAVAQGSVEDDRNALVAFYDSTGGDNWRGNAYWKSDRPLDQWFGVFTDTHGRVIALHLISNRLTGEIPAELGNLTNLEELSLDDNQLTGEIPAELGNLAILEWLILDRNQLTGEIPAELGNLTNLEWLTMNTNQLTGEIPAELGNLANLEELSLRDNQLTGEISSELGNLINLEKLYLSNNQLVDEIPAELGNLVNLKKLWLSYNQLTGEIPAELGSLVHLEELSLHSNQLTGEIPVALENLINLKFFNIFNNQLTGNFPAGLCRRTLTIRFYGNPSLIVDCFGVPDEFADNERRYFEILQDDTPVTYKNVEFILIQENAYARLWISEETFNLFHISGNAMNESLNYVFSSTLVDPRKGILEYSIDLLGNLRRNYSNDNNGERIIDILCHPYEWFLEGLAFPSYLAIPLSHYDHVQNNQKRIAEVIAHEFIHGIHFSYAWGNDFFAEGLAEWASKDIVFDQRSMPSGIFHIGPFANPNLPLFPPRPFSYRQAKLFVAYIADRVGVENMKHILQVCRPGGVCDPDDPDNGDWYDGIDGLDYALSLLDSDLNIMNIALDFHTTNLVHDASVTLNGVSYEYKSPIYANPRLRIIPYINVYFVNTNFSQNTTTIQPGGANYFRYKNTSNLHFSINTDDPQITLLRLFKEKGNSKELVDIDAGVDEYTVAGDYDRVTLITVHGNPRGDQPDLTLNISATQNYGLATGDEELPTVLALRQNYPNPFNPETVIEYELPQTVHVRLAVYDMTGRTVAVLVDGNRPQGRYTERFNAAGLSTGTYVYRLTAGGESQTQIMTLVR